VASDGNGKVVVAGECCMSRVATVFGSGLYVDRQYDFMVPSGYKPASEGSREQVLDVIAGTQDLVAKKLDTVAWQGGVYGPFNVSRLNHPWTIATGSNATRHAHIVCVCRFRVRSTNLAVRLTRFLPATL
jgi:hypothetical protein